MNIVFLETAKQDLNEIHGYIHDNLANPFAAQNTVETILRKINALKKFPNVGISLSGLSSHLKQYQSLIAGNYIIVYRQTKSKVIIVHIFYARRDYARLLEE